MTLNIVIAIPYKHLVEHKMIYDLSISKWSFTSGLVLVEDRVMKNMSYIGKKNIIHHFSRQKNNDNKKVKILMRWLLIIMWFNDTVYTKIEIKF